MGQTPFMRSADSMPEKMSLQCLNLKSGAHRFFRLSGPEMQRRFAELVEHDEIPRLLIHGNPHVANYCKTQRGTAMVDFDRSRIGPYAYDIVRFLISVSLSRVQPDERLLHPIILDHFRRGYLFGLLRRERDYEEMRGLRVQAPKKWQRDTRSYLDAGKKWAGRVVRFRVKQRRRHLAMLKDYLSHRDELDLLESHALEDIAEVAGSMGKCHTVYVLQPNTREHEPIIIDLKEVYDEPDNTWYHNPFEHHGDRMNAAGELYAPGWELRPGKATWKGIQYWGRQIPTQQVKLSDLLSELEQCDLCFSVGTQLGSGHARAGDKATRKRVQADFEARFSNYVAAAQTMRLDLLAAHSNFCASVDRDVGQHLRHQLSSWR